MGKGLNTCDSWKLECSHRNYALLYTGVTKVALTCMCDTSVSCDKSGDGYIVWYVTWMSLSTPGYVACEGSADENLRCGAWSKLL